MKKKILILVLILSTLSMMIYKFKKVAVNNSQKTQIRYETNKGLEILYDPKNKNKILEVIIDVPTPEIRYNPERSSKTFQIPVDDFLKFFPRPKHLKRFPPRTSSSISGEARFLEEKLFLTDWYYDRKSKILKIGIYKYSPYKEQNEKFIEFLINRSKSTETPQCPKKISASPRRQIPEPANRE